VPILLRLEQRFAHPLRQHAARLTALSGAHHLQQFLQVGSVLHPGIEGWLAVSHRTHFEHIHDFSPAIRFL